MHVRRQSHGVEAYAAAAGKFSFNKRISTCIGISPPRCIRFYKKA